MPKHNLKLVHKIQFSQNLFILYFFSQTKIKFEPGQYLSFEVAPKTYRNYSIFCHEGYPNNLFNTSTKFINSDESFLGIIVNTTSCGTGSEFVKKINVGDDLVAIGPAGKFRLVDNNNQNIFIATSTGFSPFTSMIKKARMINDNPITIYFGARNINDIFVVELIKEFKNINIKIFLSGCESLQNLPKPLYENINYEIFSGRIGSQIIDDFSSLSHQNTNFYLCGNPTMVNEIGQLLKQNNFEYIFEERFIPSIQ